MSCLYELDNGRVCDVYKKVKNSPGVFKSSKFGTRASLSWLRKHNLPLVFGGGESDFSVPKSKFRTTRDIGPALFSLEEGPGGTFIVRNVPIYKTHGDTRKSGHVSDQKFLDRMVKNFYQVKAATGELFGNEGFAWLPKWHYGHTPSDGDLPEQSCAGFIDNLQRVDDFLIGDIVGLDKSAAEKLVRGEFPDRSAEVDIRRGRLLSVAALGFRSPHFGLPSMRPELLKDKWNDLIGKHSFSKEISNVLLTREDLSMKTKEKIAPDAALKFLLALQTDEALSDKFEALKDQAIQKHFDMTGMQPQGPDLNQIILQLMQQMMTQKQNTDSNSPYNMNVSDVLDLESGAHHANEDQGWQEEGTGVAGSDDLNIRKGKTSRDEGVDEKGSPTGSANEGSADTAEIDSEGSIVKNTLEIEKKWKKSLTSGNDEQVNAAVTDIMKNFGAMASFVEKQGDAIKELQKQRASERLARRKEHIKNRLVGMFERGVAAVSSQKLVDKHLKRALNMSETESEEYLNDLDSTPVMKHTRGVNPQDVIKNADLSADAEKEYNSLPPMAKKCIEKDQFAFLDKFDEFRDSHF